MDRRLSRSSVHGADTFERLQAIHEAALEPVRGMHDLTPGMRAVTATFTFVGALDNGGFVACMQSVAGDFTADAISAAKLIGANEHAAVFEEFVRVALLGDASMGPDVQERRADEMSDEEHAALERLADTFSALPDITEMLDDYVDEHPHEFFFDWDEPSPWAMCPELLDPRAAHAFVEAVDDALGPRLDPDRGGREPERLTYIRVYLATLLSNADSPVSQEEVLDVAVRDLRDTGPFE